MIPGSWLQLRHVSNRGICLPRSSGLARVLAGFKEAVQKGSANWSPAGHRPGPISSTDHCGLRAASYASKSKGAWKRACWAMNVESHPSMPIRALRPTSSAHLRIRGSSSEGPDVLCKRGKEEALRVKCLRPNLGGKMAKLFCMHSKRTNPLCMASLRLENMRLQWNLNLKPLCCHCDRL